MQPISSASALLNRISELRSGAKQFNANIFAEPQVLSKWIAHGELSLLDTPGAVLIVRRGIRVLHVFHAVSDPDALGYALRKLDAFSLGEALSVDLVGSAKTIAPIRDIYVASGFSSYQKMVRMIRTKVPVPPTRVDDTPIARPGRSQADGVQDFLARLLDPYSEQIPTRGDLLEAAENGEILCISDGGTICGVLVFRLTGQSSLLRYWFVDPAKHGRGIGAALMRTFLAHAAHCSRIVLWVFAGNKASIAKYQHYGFNRDVLQDWIMLKMPQKETT